MEITVNAIESCGNLPQTTSSPWETLFSGWLADLSQLLSNPSLQQNLLGQIEALEPLAEQIGGTVLPLFTQLSQDYQAFLADPSQSTLSPLAKDIQNLVNAQPQYTPNLFKAILASASCQLLMGKFSDSPQDTDEIDGIIAAISAFVSPISGEFADQVQQIQKDYNLYLSSGNFMYLSWTETSLTALISMLITP